MYVSLLLGGKIVCYKAWEEQKTKHERFPFVIESTACEMIMWTYPLFVGSCFLERNALNGVVRFFPTDFDSQAQGKLLIKTR